MNAQRRTPLTEYTPDVTTLTSRQRQVVEYLVAGHSVPEIAAALRCTEATVRAHIQAIAKDLPGPHPPMRRILVYGPVLLGEQG